MKQDFSETAPLSIFELSKEQLYAELQKGMDDIAAGRVLPADEVIDDILLSLATERRKARLTAFSARAFPAFPEM